MTWTERLNAVKPVIIKGQWDDAEAAWASLRKPVYSDEELNAWIDLQVDILTNTRNDPLKSGLRKEAMEQMYWSAEGSRKHLEWLKSGLATNLFIEPEVISEARRLVSDLDPDKKSTK